MTPRTPEDAHRRWAEYFNAGDLEGLMTLYHPQATLVPQPGQTVTGHAAIREAIQGFLALKGTFTLDFQKAFEGPDVALVFSRWTLSGTAPDGSPLALSGQTSDVLGRQTDGSWLFVIDDPWGGQAVS